MAHITPFFKLAACAKVIIVTWCSQKISSTTVKEKAGHFDTWSVVGWRRSLEHFQMRSKSLHVSGSHHSFFQIGCVCKGDYCDMVQPKDFKHHFSPYEPLKFTSENGQLQKEKPTLKVGDGLHENGKPFEGAPKTQRPHKGPSCELLPKCH